MRILKFASAFVGVLCSTASALGVTIALFTGDPLWQPIALGFTTWVVLTPATAVFIALVDRAGGDR